MDISHVAVPIHSGNQGILHYSAIRCYDDTFIKFGDRAAYEGAFAPGFTARDREGDRGRNGRYQGVGLASIDHIVSNVELGAMNRWVDFFAQTMGFSQLSHFDDKDSAAEYSALMSKVMQNGNGKVKFPINEPAEGKKKSQPVEDRPTVFYEIIEREQALRGNL